MTGRLFRRAALFSTFITLFSLAWSIAHRNSLSIYTWQEAFAVAAILVIAPSLALSSFAYFWNFADKLVVYRKSLGVQGLLLGLVHIGIAIVNNGIASSALTLESTRDLSIVTGYLATLLFVLMPVATSGRGIRILGGKRVRLALRYLGYTGYLLVLAHGALIAGDRWLRWLQTLDPMIPPATLGAFVIGVAVVLLRIALFVSQVHKKHVARA